MEQQEKNERTQQEQEIQEGLKGKSSWHADWGFPILAGIMLVAIFAGTHMYVIYGVGAFNEVSIVAMLKTGLDGGFYGVAAALGVSFLLARISEGSLAGILDSGGSILTGIGIGVSTTFLSMGIRAPVENSGLALLTDALLGLAVGGIIVLVRKFIINQGNSTFGADVTMGAGSASGCFLSPLIISSAAGASIPIGIGAMLGVSGFYIWKRPIAGGVILGTMIFGAIFSVSL